MSLNREVIEALLNAAESPGAFKSEAGNGLRVRNAILSEMLCLLDNLPLAVFWKDLDLVYLGCNTYFARDAGQQNPRDIVGKTDFDLPWNDRQTAFFRKCDRTVLD